MVSGWAGASVCCVVTRSLHGRCYHHAIVRRLAIASVVLLVILRATTPGGAQGTPQPPQPPVFRAGTNLVQVDAIVTDDNGRPLTDLTAADFEVFDDGQPGPSDRGR